MHHEWCFRFAEREERGEQSGETGSLCSQWPWIKINSSIRDKWRETERNRGEIDKHVFQECPGGKDKDDTNTTIGQEDVEPWRGTSRKTNRELSLWKGLKSWLKEHGVQLPMSMENPEKYNLYPQTTGVAPHCYLLLHTSCHWTRAEALAQFQP